MTDLGVPDNPDEDLSRTRRAWHGVAELVLAGPQDRQSGSIRLSVAPGGFGTTKEPRLAVSLGDLVVGETRIPLDGMTCAALGELAGVPAGAPEHRYSGGSGVNPDEVLTLTPAAVAVLAKGFQNGDAALRAFAPDQTPVLWPEHFDVGITVAEVNYGVSPGDGYLAEPYAYVGPWQPRPGEFWNAPFGAARVLRELPTVDDVLAFFTAGRDQL